MATNTKTVWIYVQNLDHFISQSNESKYSETTSDSIPTSMSTYTPTSSDTLSPLYSIGHVSTSIPSLDQVPLKWFSSMDCIEKHPMYISSEIQYILNQMKQSHYKDTMFDIHGICTQTILPIPIASISNWMFWMYTHLPKCRNIALNKWILPGSHNSGTFTECLPHSLKSLSQTQNRPIFNQLEDGIRYLDLRFCYNIKTKLFHVCHCAIFETELVEDVLKPILHYLEKYPQDVLLLEMRLEGHSEKETDVYTHFIQLIFEHLHSFLIPSTIPYQSTTHKKLPSLQDIYQYNNTVKQQSQQSQQPPDPSPRGGILILFHTNATIESSVENMKHWFWNYTYYMTSNHYFYSNECNQIQNTIETIDKALHQDKIKYTKQKKIPFFRVLNTSMSSPSSVVMDIKKYGFGKFIPSLKLMTLSLSPLVCHHLLNNKFKYIPHLNILSSDFYHLYSFIETCLELNMDLFSS